VTWPWLDAGRLAAGPRPNQSGVRLHGSQADAFHLEVLCGCEVIVFESFVDLIEGFTERGTRGIEVIAELPVTVAVEPFGRVVACGSGRLAQLQSIVEILSGRTFADVLEYEPPEMAAQLPRDQILMFPNRLLRHALMNQHGICQ
jgi:hypothetical protein